MTCRFGPLVVDYDARVLEPRTWTFAQSEWTAQLAASAAPGPILELCAGAGHIGLAAAVLADRDLVAVEADPVAAGYARANAERAGWGRRTEVRLARLEGALQPGEQFGVIVADPPYLPSADVGRWPADPAFAIDGGVDGLDVVRACLAVAERHLADDGRLVLQVAGPAQGWAVAALLGPALTHLGVRAVDDERALVLVGRSGEVRLAAES